MISDGRSHPAPGVHFLCVVCDRRLSQATGGPPVRCEHCGSPTSVIAPPTGAIINSCAACGHDQLYFQKDFNRTTGLVLVAIGAVFVPWTWGLSLLGVTILDYVVWRVVKNVIVCYRCQAVHRGYPLNPSLQPFDLVTHDRHVYGAAPPGAE